MDDLKRVEGKTIKSIERNDNGKKSYLIIKFTEGGKMNISAYPNGSEGSGQLEVETYGLKTEDIINKKIRSVIEEFDGTNDYLKINLKDGGLISISAFGSSEKSNASLSVDVYVENIKIAEMANLVAESFEEFWPQYVSSFNEKDILTNQISKMLSNSLKTNELDRSELNFIIESTGEEVTGIPLAKMDEGKSYLFKIKSGDLKNVNTNDIIF